MAHGCPYCRVPVQDDAPVCPRCGGPQPAPPQGSQPEGNGWVRWVDPMEAAFAVMLPQGWAAQGGTFRGGPYGLPECRFEARADHAGLFRVLIGGQAWQFQDAPQAGGMGGFFGGFMQMLGGMPMMPGVEALPWCDAAAFFQGWYLPRLGQSVPGATVRRVEPRPDVLPAVRQKVTMDAAARGLGGYQIDVTVAEILLEYACQGSRVLERFRVQTLRMGGGAMNWMTGMMPSATWFGEIAFALRAPADRFDEAEPTLRAIAESMQKNPQWEAAQLQSDNARAFAMQQQNMARQQQISQTLSQTSDIVAGAYWSQEQIHQQHQAGRQAMGTPAGGDWSQNWSNATLGWEDRYDAAGNRYSVEAHHERVWRDNQGNFHSGNALTNPDPTWHELKKPGE